MVQSIAFTALLIFTIAINPAFGFDLTQIPDFQDGQWEFIKEEVEGLWTGEEFAAWGRSKKYFLKEDPDIVGAEIRAFGEEVFYKNWGRKDAKSFYHALLSVEKKWVPFPPGSTARGRGVYDRRSRAIIGVQFEIHLPSGRIFGLYLPNPHYKNPTLPVQRGAKERA